MSPIVTAERLSKTFRVKVRDPGLKGALAALVRPRYRDVHAVRDVTFRIEPGEIVAFLGPNGAGKTTTLKMLTGLLYPTTGQVEVAGFVPWTGGRDFKRRIALVLGNRQQLVWDLPPEETFLWNRAIYDIPEAAYRERLAELVDLLELRDVLEKPVRQLSLGERMKCELAAALLHHPPLLFLDEPTLGLDVTAQEAIRRFLSQYRERHGATVLLTSHYMQDVTALASRVLIINRGRLLYDGALDALVARIARIKRIELVLGPPPDGVTAETLAAFGTVRSFHFPNAVLEVRREEAAATSARLLAALPVADLNFRLARPIHPAHEAVAENIAYKARTAGMILVVWLIVAAAWPAVRLPFGAGRWALTAAAVLLAAAMRFFISFATGLLAFWTTRATAIMELHAGISLFLSGRLAPLALLPPAVARVAVFSWFPYILAFPVDLLTGAVHGAAVVRGFVGQIVWLAVWLGAYRLAWTRGLRR